MHSKSTAKSATRDVRTRGRKLRRNPHHRPGCWAGGAAASLARSLPPPSTHLSTFVLFSTLKDQLKVSPAWHRRAMGSERQRQDGLEWLFNYTRTALRPTPKFSGDTSGDGRKRSAGSWMPITMKRGKLDVLGSDTSAGIARGHSEDGLQDRIEHFSVAGLLDRQSLNSSESRCPSSTDYLSSYSC